MRTSIKTALSSVSLSTLLLAATPALAQTETQQVEAQRTNDAVKCAPITDSAARQKCVETQGTNALPVSGADDGEQIVVTGSRIRRPNFETLQPSVVIDSAQIESRGFATIGDALNEQPSFGVPGSSPVGANQGGSFGSGQSFVNFLGLGDQRTLTLVNGRRFVSSNTASIFGPSSAGTQVDLNTINTKLVDRVETIAIGGAPIYGSDAIAGTVNVILKRNYQGFDIDAQYGVAEQGDAPNYRVRALAGRNFADGRGNITLSGEYNVGKGLVYNDRAITRLGRFEGDCLPGSPYTSCLFDNRRLPTISESGIPTVGGDPFGVNFVLSPGQANAFFGDPSFSPGVFDASGNQVQFNPSGQLIPIDFGSAVGGPNDFETDFSGGNGFNLFNTLQLLTNTKRYNLNLLTQFQVTPSIRLFGEGWYAYSKGTNLRNQPIYNSGLFDAGGTTDGPIIFRLNNPYLSAQQRALIQNSIDNSPFSDQNNCFTNQVDGNCAAQDYFYLTRANTDLATGRASTATQLYRGVLGVDGTFNVGDHKFNWELVGNYGHTVTKGSEPVVVQQNFLNAVNATRDSSGNIVCAPGFANSPVATASATCAPLNLFGTGVTSQAARDYVTTNANPTGRNSQMVVTGSVSGPLFRLPGGDLSAALGFEHRRESTNFSPGVFYYGGNDPNPTTDANGDGDLTNDRVQYGRSVPILPVSGRYHTNELFGELRAAVIGPANNVPLVRSLELHGAARYVKHSIAGNDWTYTVEGRWGIIKDLAVRANYTRAIRAPAITELFNPSSSFFGFASDPCDRRNRGNGPDPTTRKANCAAAGIPANFNSRSNQASFPQAIAGNVALSNEKSRAYSFGTILSPRFIPGLTISADYLNIKLANAITQFSASQVVQSCYDSKDYPNNQFCGLVRRASSGQLNYVQTRFFNAASYKYKGVLGSLDYRTKTPFLGSGSQIGVNLQYQYLRKLTQQSDPVSTPAQLSGGIGYPKHSAVLNLNYQNGVVGLFTSVNYTGKVKEDPQAAANFSQYPDRKAVAFVNSGISFDVAKRMTFRFMVDNVLNTKPPFPSPAGGGAVSYFPGILGRYYRVGAGIHF